MEYRLLGQTGLYVSALSLGTMGYGGGNGFWKNIGDLEIEEVKAQMAQAVDAGVNLIDTADYYSAGGSEEMLGAALEALGLDRSSILISTKARLRVGPGPNDVGNTRHHLVNQVEASLRRLRTDHIDIYYLHGVDTLTPIEETLRALDDLIRAGKIRYIGLSNFPAWRIMKALGAAERLSLPRVAAAQMYYSMVGRDIEREIVPLAEAERVGVVAWSPLAGGFLARTEQPNAATRRDVFAFPPVDEEEGAAARAALAEVAARTGASPAAISLAWVLSRPAVASVTIGGRTKEQLAETLRAADLKLSPEDLAVLDAATAPRPAYPGWMEARQGADRSPDATSIAVLKD
ncbi:MAG: aldo/keto reductase [Paracoccaceae bacterium]